jgi:hypothetical protein
MKNLSSILVIVSYNSSKSSLRTLILNSIVLGRWIGAGVHFLANQTESNIIKEVVAEIKATQAHDLPTVVIDLATGDPMNSVLQTIDKYSCGLVVFENGIALHPTKGVGERELLEVSPIPVLLLPKRVDFKKCPPRGFLVPLGGTHKTSEALSVALRLASQTNSTVDLLHVRSPAESGPYARALENVGDQLHHEYANMAEKIAAEASPYSTAQERSHIGHLCHCTGFITEEIIKPLNRSSGLILAVEWSGTLREGRASTIKGILKKTRSPVLFVKAVHEEISSLRVGKNLRSA